MIFTLLHTLSSLGWALVARQLVGGHGLFSPVTCPMLKFSPKGTFVAMARRVGRRGGSLGSLVLLGLGCLGCLGWATAMVPAIRAIITDVDGTLMPFATSSRLSGRTRAALTAAKEAGCAVAVATGRIPGPWYDSLCSQLPGVFGPGVFSNGALVLGDEVFHASVLPAETVASVVECLVEGRVLGRKIGTLAVVAGDGFEYSELAPEGPTWVTQLIQRAGEPVTPRGSWNPWLLQREVHKFVLFTVPDDPTWAAMDQVVPLLREKLATSATVLDCGAKQCEILPPGENKGT